MHTLLFYEDPAIAAALAGCAAAAAAAGCDALCVLALAILGALIVFYRDFDGVVRRPDPDSVYSPCNGTIMACSDAEIIVFLSPLDVHTQKAPVKGTIVMRESQPGEFNPAYMLEKSAYNEKVTTVFRSAHTDDLIEVDQIAGQLARRIVGWKKVGDRVEAGATYGLIKLSSQCRVRVPDGYECNVCVGERIVGGDTVLFTRSAAPTAACPPPAPLHS
jgi:phosphatidylserine decarboxylase